MKFHATICLMLLSVSSVCCYSQGESEAAREQLRNKLKTTLPGPQQMQMVKRVGRYKTVTKYWAKADAAPVTSNGSSSIREILDGGFILEESSTTINGPLAAGVRIFGFNNQSREYEASWVYAGSTAIISLRGGGSDDASTINYSGTVNGNDPVAVSFRQINDDLFVVTIEIGAPDAPERSRSETTYQRQK